MFTKDTKLMNILYRYDELVKVIESLQKEYEDAYIAYENVKDTVKMMKIQLLEEDLLFLATSFGIRYNQILDENHNIDYFSEREHLEALIARRWNEGVSHSAIPSYSGLRSSTINNIQNSIVSYRVDNSKNMINNMKYTRRFNSGKSKDYYCKLDIWNWTLSNMLANRLSYYIKKDIKVTNDLIKLLY